MRPLISRATIRAPPAKRFEPFPPFQHQARRIADLRAFQAGDHVALRSKKDRAAAPLFCATLTPGRRVDTHKGFIRHEDIIGKRVRDVVRTELKAADRRGAEYRLHQVKLEEYVRWTKRLVTPLYAQDIQLIVGLLDLHVAPPRWGKARDEPALEILEAGTGHGALTLHLSRAIHAANPSIPWTARSLEGDDDMEEADHVALEAWKATRRAVIHSIEVSPKYSAHAENIVKGFRQRMYYHNIDFHVGSVSEWVTDALSRRGGTPFLSHAFLDLPGTETHLEAVASALRTDGTLIVFSPSITQIIDCFTQVKQEDLPVELDEVIELGVNGGTGGRRWDVRAVRPRVAQKMAQETADRRTSTPGVGGRASAEDGHVLEEPESQETGRETELEHSPEQIESIASDRNEGDWKMVCRPKVGEMVVGGGFLGVFRKQR